MRRKHRRLFLNILGTTLILMVGLPGCSLPGSGGTPVNEECLNLPAPWTTLPINTYTLAEDELETTVTFTWYTPTKCVPDSFLIIMNDVPAFSESHEYVYEERVSPPPGDTITYEDFTSAVEYSWTTTETFTTGIYWWWVRPYYGDFHGERSPGYKVIINSSENCSEAIFNNIPYAAEPVYPRDGGTVHTLSPSLIFRDRSPQYLHCYNGYAQQYIILYSQGRSLLGDDFIDRILDAQPDYQWDFDDGWWEFWGDDLSEYEYILPDGIYAVPIYGDRQAAITLRFCAPTYWRVISLYMAHQHPRFATESSVVFHFSVDPALCEVEPIPSEAPPTAEFLSPMAVPHERANCRSGPALDYPILSILPAGEQFEIRGRNTDEDAWLVFDPEINNTCWVNADLVEVIGITDLVEIVIPAPAPVTGPTDTPPYIVDCSQYNGALWQSCNLDPACYWDPSVPPNGECKNK